MANLVTVPYTVWTDEVMLRCPGSSPSGVEQALLNTLREFCVRSAAWVVELWDKNPGDDTPQPFNDGADVAFYDFQAKLEAIRAGIPGGVYATGDPAVTLTHQHVIDDYGPWDIAFIHHIAYFESFTWNTNPSLVTQQVSKFIVPAMMPNMRAGTPMGSGTPTVFRSYNERPGNVQVIPTLKGDTVNKEGIVPWVALTFPRTYVSDSVPVVFERMWYEDILDGTLSKLMSQQDKPYTNPVVAQYHATRFRNAISQARDMAQRQFNNSERGWMYPAWA